MMTYIEAIRKCQEELKLAGIAESESDAFILFEYVIGIRRHELFLKGNESISSDTEQELFRLINLRKNHIPVQHLTGVQNFMGFDFKVNEDVLIPRFDTEILVENVISEINNLRKNRTNSSERVINILDICTGSGCIIISLLKNLPSAVGIGTDISEKALKIANDNKRLHGVERLTLVNTDLIENIEGEFDVIVSNPPYIETSVVEELDDEVKNHEPRLALDGGEDGLIFYRRIANEALDSLKCGGILAVEIGYNQGPQVRELFVAAGLSNVRIIKDYAGLDRVVIGNKTPINMEEE